MRLSLGLNAGLTVCVPRQAALPCLVLCGSVCVDTGVHPCVCMELKPVGVPCAQVVTVSSVGSNVQATKRVDVLPCGLEAQIKACQDCHSGDQVGSSWLLSSRYHSRLHQVLPVRQQHHRAQSSCGAQQLTCRENGMLA